MHAETSLHMSQMAHQAGAYLWILCIIIFLYEATSSVSSPPPPPWMQYLSITGLPTSIKFAKTYLYTWVERSTLKVHCYDKSITQCTWPGLEHGWHSNHLATMSLNVFPLAS